jgi:hypothetical protein
VPTIQHANPHNDRPASSPPDLRPAYMRMHACSPAQHKVAHKKLVTPISSCLSPYEDVHHHDPIVAVYCCRLPVQR